MADSLFGVAGRALQLCEDRTALLTGNIANASTPNYKAKDIDFAKMIKQAEESDSFLQTNNPKHINTSSGVDSESIMYRVPMQKSVDGNTVDGEIERKNFIENALNYQVNLTFIQSKSDQLMKAIRGE
jgi:flagellar basal-body rod protein FlgB